MIEENIKRLGIRSIKTEVFDALKLDENLIGKVDYLLLDAPCSGFGLIRRKPDIKWNRTKEEVNSLVEIQERMLNIASNYIKDNGVLVYSTCTINNDENINQITKFLNNNPKFELQSFKISNKMIDQTQNRGYLQLLPSVHGTDGFFIAKMIKNNSILK